MAVHSNTLKSIIQQYKPVLIKNTGIVYYRANGWPCTRLSGVAPLSRMCNVNSVVMLIGRHCPAEIAIAPVVKTTKLISGWIGKNKNYYRWITLW